jgi:membrane associated rhomboid family serine protease
MTKWVKFLLIANVIIFFFQMTSDAFTANFAFTPTLFFRQPWTLVTYMFLHGGLGHIFFNMLGLYFFGSRVEDRLGSNKFITLYFISGITGGLFGFMFPMVSVIGASGALFGVMLAYAWFWPKDRIMIYGVIPVEARVLVIIYGVMSVMGMGGGGGGGNTAHFAHLGGLVGAFFYLYWLRHDQGAKKFRAAVTPKVPETALANWQKVNPQSVHEVNRDELNRILDKVSKSGLASLSPDERRFLMSFVPPDDRPPMVS